MGEQDRTVAGSAGLALLERKRELGLLDEAVQSTSTGRGRMVLVEGPAGVGKSRLVHHAIERARTRDFRIFTARGIYLERDYPYGVVFQLFERTVQQMTDGARAAAFKGAARLCRPLFDGISATEENGDAYPILHGLYWLTTNLASDRPVLLVVDNLHWTDPSSLRFLLYVAHRLQDGRVMLLAAGRPGEAEDEDRLAQFRTLAATTLRPSPLSRDAVASIVRRKWRAASEGSCSSIWELTGGNPYLLTEFLAAVDAAGLDPDRATTTELARVAPTSLDTSVRTRLQRLDAKATEVAMGVAILGGGATSRHVSALVGLSPKSVARARRALVAAEILTPGEPMDFVHPLVMSAIYEGVPVERRVALHTDAARLLKEAGAAPEMIASHLLETEPSRDPWVLDTLRRAGAKAFANGAPDSASRFLRRALEGITDPNDRAEVLLQLSTAEELIEPEAALTHLIEAIDLLDEPLLRSKAHRRMGKLLYGLGRHTEAAAAFETAAQVLPEGHEELALQLRAEYISAARVDVELRPAALGMLEELKGADVSGSAGRRMHAELAMIEVREGSHRSKAVEHIRKVLPASGRFDPELIEPAVIGVLTQTLVCTDELGLLRRCCDAILADARARGSIMTYATARGFGAVGLYRMGRVDDAISAAQDALAAEQYGWGVSPFYMRAWLAHGLMERLDLAAATRVLDEAFNDVRLAASIEFPWVLEARSRLHLIEGRIRAAEVDAREAARLTTEVLQTDNPAMIAWRTCLAAALYEQGERGEALRVATEDEELARAFGAASFMARAIRLRAMLLDQDDALPLFEEAVEVADASPAVLARSWSRLYLGSALRARGDALGARHVLTEALRIASLCGSRLVAERVRAELIAAGGRPRRSAAAGLASLTPGERRVVELAATGMSNRDIAETQFVTVKAVEWHLNNAYRKLGVRSRAALPALIAEAQAPWDDDAGPEGARGD